MDYRNRVYYLVTFDSWSYEMRMRYIKLIDSVKLHSPYNHFGIGYDGDHKDITGMGYIQNMVSCSKSDKESLECELRKASKNDTHSYFKEITKELCKQ